jgi:hypothetical protein
MSDRLRKAPILAVFRKRKESLRLCRAQSFAQIFANRLPLMEEASCSSGVQETQSLCESLCKPQTQRFALLGSLRFAFGGSHGWHIR